MFAIVSLLAVVAVSLLITRIATVVLVATGMPRHVARFQARSAFTGAGFTTTESEDVVSHPLRRRVVMTLMLLGNAGVVAAASGLILGFRGGAAGAEWMRVLVLVCGLIALVFATRAAWVDRRLTRVAEAVLHRWFGPVDTADRSVVAELSSGRVVTEVCVRPDDGLAGATVADLERRGARVLAIESAGGGLDEWPPPNRTLAPGDTAVTYGPADAVS